MVALPYLGKVAVFLLQRNINRIRDGRKPDTPDDGGRGTSRTNLP
jgi:hypothetical protein